MSRTKTEFKWFTVPEYEKEQEYLSQMHKIGWKLVRIGFPGFYHFEACTPEDVTYQLDYNQEGISHKSEYIQMFHDCGWEYLFDFVGYSYFKKPASEMDGEEEIFCDDESRLDMMKRVYKGRLIPLIISFFGVIIPQLLMQIANYSSDEPFRVFFLALFIALFLLYLILFIQFAVQYYAYKKKVKR